jgi:hypothetical protein
MLNRCHFMREQQGFLCGDVHFYLASISCISLVNNFIKYTSLTIDSMPQRLKPAEGGVYWLHSRKVRKEHGITMDIPDEAVPQGAFGHMCVVVEQTKDTVKIMTV